MIDLKLKRLRLVLLIVCIAWFDSSNAQNNLVKNDKTETFSLKERFAFRANLMGWVLMTPNLGIQFDVTPWEYNKWTVGANVKWNPGSGNGADWNYRILDTKLEARKYFRDKKRRAGSNRTPKYWRAYYWGVYAGFSDYEILFSNGYRGKNWGAGLTAGWEVPLYKFKDSALDFDFGLSAGWIFGKNAKLKSDENGIREVRTKNWHLTPYPVISEIRVALVYRFMSVKNKYKKSKY